MNKTKNMAFLTRDLITITDSNEIECNKKDTQILINDMKKLLELSSFKKRYRWTVF
jgi:5'-3' exonuclease